MSDDDVEVIPAIVQAVVFKWCEVVAEGDAGAMWFLTDANLRLCFAQRWVYESRAQPEVASLGNPEALAHRLAGPAPTDEDTATLWPHLLVDTCRYVSLLVPSFPKEQWDFLLHRRVVGQDLEVALLVDSTEITGLPAGEMLAISPEVGSTFLLRNDGQSQPEIAGFSYSRPEPGWPPRIPTEV